MIRRFLTAALLSGILVSLASMGTLVGKASAAGPPALVTVTPSTSQAICGVPISVGIRVVDSLGAAVTTPMSVTITTSLGAINPSLTGTVNGVANTTFSSNVGGTAVITAASGGLMGQATINVVCNGGGAFCGYGTICQPCTVYGCQNQNLGCTVYYNSCTTGCAYTTACVGNCGYLNVCTTAPCTGWDNYACSSSSCGGVYQCGPANCGLYRYYAGCGTSCYGGSMYGGCQPLYYSAAPVLPPVQVYAQQANYAPPSPPTYTQPSTQVTYAQPAAPAPQVVYNPPPAQQQQTAARPFFPPNTGSGGIKAAGVANTSSTLPFLGIVLAVFTVGVLRLRKSSSESR